MGALFDAFPFPDQSRMTGIWANSALDLDTRDELVLIQMIELGRDQDPAVESDFMIGHLPFQVGGFHGVFPDGQGWTVVLLTSPEAIADVVANAPHGHWALVDGVDRALRMNPSAVPGQQLVITRDLLRELYGRHGVDSDALRSWSTAELLWGLLAECCGVELRDVAAGYDAGCALPSDDHICCGDVFRDVFAHWVTQ